MRKIRPDTLFLAGEKDTRGAKAGGEVNEEVLGGKDRPAQGLIEYRIAEDDRQDAVGKGRLDGGDIPIEDLAVSGNDGRGWGYRDCGQHRRWQVLSSQYDSMRAPPAKPR